MSDPNAEFERYKDKVRDIFSANKRGRGNGSGSGSGQPPFSFGNHSVAYIVIGIFVIVTAMNSFYTVQPDEEGVVTRFGEYLKKTDPGPHIKLPFIDKVYKVRSKRRQEEVFGFRKNPNGGTIALPEESLMLTGDLNLASVQWMVQYEISDPWKVLFRAKDVQKTLRDVSMSVMRRVVGDRLVGEVLTVGRAEIAIEAKEIMQSTLDQYDVGIRITTIELQNATPPEKVKPAFNEVNAAKQEQEQAINRAEREYNKIIPEAKGRAEQMIADAQAYSVRVVNRAKGDANRFKSMMNEYKKAPSITKDRIYLETMEEILSSVERFSIVDEDAKGLIPIYGGLPIQSDKPNMRQDSH